MNYTKNLDKLINNLKTLPGIGPKMAERLAFYIIKLDQLEVDLLIDSIFDAKKNLKYCDICGSLTENNICDICKDDMRDKDIICVVENPFDVFVIEKMKEYKGLFHVLGGVISPLDSIFPEDLNIKNLEQRLKYKNIKEIIIATNSTVEGEATALYLLKILKNYNIKITRIAKGIPVGADLEYIDSVTLSKAIENRSELSELI
ncbi:MAG: recombination mediator RecR [Elusimicrobiota bacterium]|jgi:recombination protein RecR|nr:recombination mediator RecR [Elusimicrobiota bacterium]